MQTWSAYRDTVPVTVIPCCADMRHFTLTDAAQRKAAREKLSIGTERLVLSYLGSIGAWYMLDEMLQLFARIKKTYPDALFLFITHSDPVAIRTRASSYGINPADLIVTEATRNEVPVYIKSSDVNISFIKPVYSKISSSPTKLGEVLAMGIPVIVNAGVGDVAMIVNETASGVVLDDLSTNSMDNAVQQIPYLLRLDPASIREKAAKFYDLDKGVALYEKAYDKLFA